MDRHLNPTIVRCEGCSSEFGKERYILEKQYFFCDKCFEALTFNNRLGLF